jgi:hypothetical protein
LKTGGIAAIALGAALWFGATSAGWAQYPGGGAPGARAGRPSGPGPAGEARNPSEAAGGAVAGEQARARLQELEEDLKPGPAQRAAWIAYSNKVQQLADDVIRNRNALRFPKGTAPEQLDFIAETLRNRLTAVEDIMIAGNALYAVLTPGQKAIADDRLARIAIPLIAPTQAIQSGGARGMPPGDVPQNPRGN